MVAAASPGADVPEAVVTTVDPERCADGKGNGLGFKFGECPVLEALMQDGVSQLVRQGLDLLQLVVANLDTDALQVEVQSPLVPPCR